MVGLQTLDRCAPAIIWRSAAFERAARARRRAPTSSARRRPSSSSGRRRSRRCRASPPRAPSSCAGAVSAGPGCTSCTCCCALSHGSTWQLPIYGAERDGEWIDTLAAVTHTATRYMANGDAVTLETSTRWQVLRGALDAMPKAARADDRRARRPPNIAAPLGARSGRHTKQAPRASSRVGAIESAAATCCRATTHSSTCSWLSSRRPAITADLAVDEDGALLRRAAGYHHRVARLLAGRADRAERLDHRVLAMRSRAGRRVRSAARVGRSGCGAREWTRAEPVELTAPESMAALKRYRGPRGPCASPLCQRSTLD